VDEVALLFRSLEAFGGELRRARRRVYFVNDCAAQTEARLRELGVEVRVVPDVEARFRFANKLAMLREEPEGTQVLVAIDSDVVVAGDFSAYLDPDVVQAKQPDGDLLTLELWRELFDHFGLELPPERYATSVRPGWTHAYFNTGVLLIPGTSLQPLYERWLHYVRAMVDEPDALPAVVEHMRPLVPHYEGATAHELEPLFYAEQWGLALALRELRLPYAALPLALNFPTIYEDEQRPGEYLRERFTPVTTTPLLLHHHHRTDGGLRPTGYRAPDATIARVNERLFGHTMGEAS
jgi:hypothetical protein